jgi:hypothetical protein
VGGLVSKRPTRGASNGRNALFSYVARFVGIVVTTAVIAGGMAWFDSSGGQLFASLLGGVAGLLAYLCLMRGRWQD